MTPLPDGVAAVFAAQARACERLDSPFMARLLTLLPRVIDAGGTVGRALCAVPGDIGPSGHSLPLRLAGGLHALALTGDPLASVYPPHAADDGALAAALSDVLARQAAALLAWLDRPPQTNEVRRSAALIAAAHWLAARYGLPMTLSELGASAGLNLAFDRFGLDAGGARRGADPAALMLAPDWRGSPPPGVPFRVAGRRGVDLAPLDPAQEGDRLRLRAYLWADQPARRALTDAAIAVAAGAVAVDRADAIDWLAGRLAPVPGRLHLVYHTVAWQYFPADAQARGESLLAGAGAAATPDAPLARLAMEADGAGEGAALTLDLWPGGRRIDLGRVDFHGRWLDWRAPDATIGA